MMNLVFSSWLIRYEIRLAKSIENLPHFRCLSLDLPFHGENKAVAVEDFEQTAQCLEEQIQHLIKDEPYIYRLFTWWTNRTILCTASESENRGILKDSHF